MKRIPLFGVAAVLVCLSVSAPAQSTFTWNVNNGNWTNAANWNPSSGAPPRSGNIGVISGKTAYGNDQLYFSPDTAPLRIENALITPVPEPMAVEPEPVMESPLERSLDTAPLSVANRDRSGWRTSPDRFRKDSRRA